MTKLLVQTNITDEIQEELSQRVFKGITPRPSKVNFVRSHFMDSMREILESPEAYIDLYLTGSLTTYQYSDNSDFDVSVFPDYELLMGVMDLPDVNAVRKILVSHVIDKIDGIILPGTTHPCQHFVVLPTNTLDELYRPGLRSAWDFQSEDWLVPPEKDRTVNIQRELPVMYWRAKQTAEKMRLALRTDPDAAKRLFMRIHNKRTQDQRAGRGDFSEGNIVYKWLLHEGLFDELKNIGVFIAKTSRNPYFSYMYIGEPINKLYVTGTNYHYTLIENNPEIESYDDYPQAWGRVKVYSDPNMMATADLDSDYLDDTLYQDYEETEDGEVVINEEMHERIMEKTKQTTVGPEAGQALADWLGEPIGLTGHGVFNPSGEKTAEAKLWDPNDRRLQDLLMTPFWNGRTPDEVYEMWAGITPTPDDIVRQAVDAAHNTFLHIKQENDARNAELTRQLEEFHAQPDTTIERQWRWAWYDGRLVIDESGDMEDDNWGRKVHYQMVEELTVDYDELVGDDGMGGSMEGQDFVDGLYLGYVQWDGDIFDFTGESYDLGYKEPPANVKADIEAAVLSDIGTTKTAESISMQVIYNFQEDRIILGSQAVARGLPHTVIVGDYRDGEVTLNQAAHQWLNTTYFKKLWLASYPAYPLTGVHLHHDDGPKKIGLFDQEEEQRGMMAYVTAFVLLGDQLLTGGSEHSNLFEEWVETYVNANTQNGEDPATVEAEAYDTFEYLSESNQTTAGHIGQEFKMSDDDGKYWIVFSSDAMGATIENSGAKTKASELLQKDYPRIAEGDDYVYDSDGGKWYRGAS